MIRLIISFSISLLLFSAVCWGLEWLSENPFDLFYIWHMIKGAYIDLGLAKTRIDKAGFFMIISGLLLLITIMTGGINAIILESQEK